MPGRAYLSEEDERAESESRDRLRVQQHRLRELMDRRAQLLQLVRQISDEQHALHGQIAPERDRVEATHEEYRELGQQLAELRARRDALRPQLEMALTRARARPAGPGARGPPAPRPEQIQREIAQLELRQQTQALPLPEENALIDRLRELRRGLTDAEKSAGARALLQQERLAHELKFRELRAEYDRLGEEHARLRAERDRRMASMRTKLAEVDRSIRETLSSTRARRQEAHRTIAQYSRGGRAARGEGTAVAQIADEQFEQLMKRGKISRGGRRRPAGIGRATARPAGGCRRRSR